MRSNTALPFLLTAAIAGWAGLTLLFQAECTGAIETNSYGVGGKTTRVRRERNLDTWDSDTLAYHLDTEYPGYDVAIMFYAPWDTHSQTLAPYWDRIATVLNAGSSQSRLIMALFDCELNAAHAQLCEAINIQFFPTLMFIGSGPFHDTDPVSKFVMGSRAAGPMGDSPVPRTVKFQGNWQYTDSVLDWIQIMQRMSNWHIWSTEGFGSKLRRFFLPKKKINMPLPVGVPRDSFGQEKMGVAAPSSVVGGGLSGGGSEGGLSAAEIGLLESQIDQYKSAVEDMEKIATRTSSMLESVLFSRDSDDGSDEIDMFEVLNSQNAWADKTSNTPTIEIYRSCVMEVSLDYCQRVANRVGSNLVDNLDTSGMSEEELMGALGDIETTIMTRLSEKEPYCGIIEDCIANDFQNEMCRPATCPFSNQSACRYLTSCMEPELMEEYATALGMKLTA
eukprot:CAMPEP_0113454966 /NCGR_PEP_ID=MMETSP0014_2-20120614/8134_1 /TAXON_ID=2857 /ORGANISM="Nitzschia sp." /LENGTH=447 /DNA_ID=CAMNT_0000346385 /DNA_START=1 /DNA_END=1344 /DNA_ORIENTATION=+ /assembly_acc=CAM_ASM_000159